MRQRLFFALPLLALLFAGASAESQEQRENQITVTGEATVNVAPDKVEITLGVENSETTVSAAKAANDAACARVLAAVRTFGVEPKDTKTDYVSITPQYNDQDSHKTLQPVGYMVRKSVVVTLRDVPKFDALMSAVVEAGANVVLNVQFLTSDLRKYRDQAREQAMKAAHEKAELLAGAVGQKVGKALSISEGWNGMYSSYGSSWNNRGDMAAMLQNVMQNAGTNEPVAGETTAPGTAQVRASVNVQFQLLP